MTPRYSITAAGGGGITWPLVAVLVVGYALYTIYSRVKRYHTDRAFKAQHGCANPTSVKRTDPLGLLFMWEAVQANKKRRLLRLFDSLFQEYGTTWVMPLWKSTVFITCDPENIKSLLATSFDDWEVKTLRQEGFGALLGDGVFTTDGAFWAHSRAMLRPTFEKSQIVNLEQFDSHIEKLIASIPADGTTIDLQDLFHCFSMDASSELLFGTSTDTLGGKNAEALSFAKDFEYAMQDGILRARLGRVYKLSFHPKAERAIRTSRKFADKYVEQAMKVKQAASVDKSSHDDKREGKFVFLNELAKHEEVDAERTRNESLNILLAGRDTTAALLSAMWYELARRPDIYKKLQAEVDELNGEVPTYEYLRNMKYLKYCAQEALRLYPPVPTLPKLALRNTILPHGGGADGLKPLFVPAGSVCGYHVYSMHRSTATYGPDAEEFRPERWADPNLRPGWGYLPFGGGPRVCLGQQYALTEAYYVTVRLMQKFRRIEDRSGGEPWREKLTATLCSYDGVKVGMWEK